jgi:hypothetical protein
MPSSGVGEPNKPRQRINGRARKRLSRKNLWKNTELREAGTRRSDRIVPPATLRFPLASSAFDPWSFHAC